MEKRLPFFIVALSLILLGSCSGNLFMDAGLEKGPDFDADVTITDSNVMSYSEDLFDGEISESLSSSEAQTAYDNLLDYATDGGTADADTPKKQAAAAAAGKVMIESNDDAKELVNSLPDIISELTADDSDPDPEDLIATFVPSDLKNDKTAFTEAINDLLAAADAFNALGSGLSDTDDPGDIGLSDGDAGGIAQMAIVAIVVSTAVDTLGSGDSDAGIEDLWTLVQDPTDPSVQFSDDDDPFDQLDDAGSLFNILSWAGYDTTF
ncbi:hypothetical protein [Sediminispirochaeta bajacaliforniensis]|uniref:hypothetical protein n=1 Tax=Sediminispirochaeta bajacaliforniensis TaxID=148 RepID=UPI000368313D|nr:hypothetical protein [Sediminispirochaeta bajacaliforniensis]